MRLGLVLLAIAGCQGATSGGGGQDAGNQPGAAGAGAGDAGGNRSTSSGGSGGRGDGAGGMARATGGAGGTGATPTGGRGAGGSGGAADAGAAVTEPACVWPTAVGSDQAVNSTIQVAKMMDGGLQRYVAGAALGTGDQSENQLPIFELADGATLQNVIVGAPGVDGIHCKGNCTLRNIWWEDVGEDAATLEGTSDSQVMTIDGGGARKAADKIFQHNGPGTMVIRDFCANDFGKLYRSCGNCATQFTRHVQVNNVSLTTSAASVAGVGMNANYNDTADLHGIYIHGTKTTIPVCQRYTANNTGAEPVSIGSGADGTVCRYTPASDVIIVK